MSTDLVTIDKPVTIQSYDDIIDRKVRSLMLNMLPEYEKFESAPIGSKEQKIFERIENFSPKIFFEETFKFLNQSDIQLGRAPAVIAVARCFAARERFPPLGRFLISVDENSKKYSNVFVITTKWKGTKLENVFDQL